MTFYVRLYQDDDLSKFVELINDQWMKNHVILHKPLFDWQFGGFGYENKKIRSLVLFDNDHMIGFRGIIPGLYQVPLVDGTMQISKGGSNAMWIVHSDYRGKKLGLKLHLKAQKIFPVITGAGSKINTSVPFYLKSGFHMMKSLYRYIIPLNIKGYKKLLIEDVQLNDIIVWSKECDISKNSIKPCNIDLMALSMLWKQVTFPLQLFSLYRNEEFWRWRYIENIGFQYLMFGDPSDSGVIVARIETADIEDSKQIKVFRIIEIIPKSEQAWIYKGEKKIESLLSGVLKWAQNEGCVTADFFSSNMRFNKFLTNIGFRNQLKGKEVLSLVPMFSPFCTVVKLINVLYKINLPEYDFIRPNFESTYMVKSENDMDRPYDFNFFK